MATRRWRPLAVASVVMATLASAVVLRAAFDDGDNATPPVPTATTSIAGASVEATPQPTLTAAEPVLVKQTFAAGQQVTPKHGIGFLSAADGSLETWSRLDPSPAPNTPLQATPDGALLVVSGEGGATPWIVERATGKTWKLGPGIELLPELAHGQVMAVVFHVDEMRQPGLLNVATGAITKFGAEMQPHTAIYGTVSPDGRRMAIQLGTEVDLVELNTGKTTPLAAGIPNDGHTRVAGLPGGLGFTVDADEPGGTRRWFSWDGVELDREFGPGSVSPGGRYIAREWSPGRIKAGGMGGYPVVGAVTIEDRQTANPLVRFLGAEPALFPDYAWSAAGDSLVLEVPDGYRVVSATGSILANIPDDIHVLDPRPSPTTPGLLGTNRGTIINLARGTTVAPLYAELVWRAHWSTRPGELIVELSSPGKGRDWRVDVMPFDVRADALDSEPKIEVDNDTDSCEPLLARPEAGSSEVECMPDGRHGRITEADDPSSEPKPSSEPVRRYAGIRERDNTAWLHVEMDNGATGWARATALRWAD